MRGAFPDAVERGRVRAGKFGTAPGQRFGLFELKRRGIHLRVIAADGGIPEADGWEHVSVSLPGKKRTPTWEEMAYVKDLFWGPDETVIQFHPAAKDYVNFHKRCLHLWKDIAEIQRTPPPHLVGPR